MNERVVVNPNFKNNAEFHRSLAARGIGVRDWPNTHTEVEYLGNGKFAASIGVGHCVFFDKADGNKPKKHKLTDERPSKDYILIQGAKCCVEVHDYYAKYFDVQHTEVRLYEERWICQRLFKTDPEEWRDVDAYNPVMELKEEDNRVSVTITYQTDYGTLIVRYAQGDGNNLAHHVLFVNESSGTETFRVLQRWAGIVGGKCNGKDIPVDIDTPEEASYLAFHSPDKPKRRFNITNNLRETLYETIQEKTGRIIEQTYWDEMLGKEVTVEVEETRPVEKRKTDKCLKLPVGVETHAQGMKADFIFERWMLAPTEVLTIGSPYALDFDGTNDYINAGNTGLPIGASARTVEIWVKRARTGNFTDYRYPFVYGELAENKAFGFYFSKNTTKLRFMVYTNDWDTGINVNDTDWHYLVATYDGTNTRAYHNGSEAPNSPQARTLNTTLSDFIIGTSPTLGVNNWYGALDEVRISDIARTPEEILANWNNGSGKRLEADEHTVALWHMDEGAGDTIFDETENDNDGTIHGASWTDGFPFGHDCPDSATLDDPTEDGDIYFKTPNYTRDKTGIYVITAGSDKPTPPRDEQQYRGYVEWSITALFGGTVTKVEFRYEGLSGNHMNQDIRAMANQPSAQSDDNAGNQVIYDDAGDGTAYLSNNGVFPGFGAGKDVGGASGPAWDTAPVADLQAAIDAVRSWFALGFGSTAAPPEDLDSISSEEDPGPADPKPTLYVEYTPPVGFPHSFGVIIE